MTSTVRPKRITSKAKPPSSQELKAVKAAHSTMTFDRFCEYICQSRLKEVDNASYNQGEVSETYLPDSYKSASEYITKWEPLLADEIIASIISNLPYTYKNPSLVIQLSKIDLLESGNDSQLVKLVCSVIGPSKPQLSSVQLISIDSKLAEAQLNNPVEEIQPGPTAPTSSSKTSIRLCLEPFVIATLLF